MITSRLGFQETSSMSMGPPRASTLPPNFLIAWTANGLYFSYSSGSVISTSAITNAGTRTSLRSKRWMDGTLPVGASIRGAAGIYSVYWLLASAWCKRCPSVDVVDEHELVGVRLEPVGGGVVVGRRVGRRQLE